MCLILINRLWEKKFEDPKWVIISRISDRQHKKEKAKKETKEQTNIKHNIENSRLSNTKPPVMNSVDPEG